MKSKLSLAILFVTILLATICYGQQFSSMQPRVVSAKSSKVNYTVKPFIPLFVQNKGQFDQYEKNITNTDFESPSFGGQMGNTIVLFNKNSIRFVENICKKKEDENEGEKRGKLPEHEIETYRQALTFVGANANAEFV